jgi:hypothetical protein
VDAITPTIEPRNTDTPYTAGRPCLRDWNALKPEIEERIAHGDGLLKLGKHYGLTPAGVRQMLRRLGLRTRFMKRS